MSESVVTVRLGAELLLKASCIFPRSMSLELSRDDRGVGRESFGSLAVGAVDFFEAESGRLIRFESEFGRDNGKEL